MNNKYKLLFCLFSLSVFISIISANTIIPQKYKVELNIVDVSIKGTGHINANFTWRNVSHSSDAEFLKEYSSYSWYFTPSLSAKNPLVNKEIKIYVSESMPDFYLCTNKLTNVEGVLKIDNFETECGKKLSEYVAVKFLFLGDDHFDSVEHIYYVSETPFSTDAFNSLYVIFVNVISDVNKAPLCIFVIILSGIVFAAMFFQGDNPLQIFDITQPRLPKAMKSLGGIVGKIKLKGKASALIASKMAAKSSAKVAALSASIYMTANLKAKKDKDKDKSMLLSRVNNNKRLNSLQKIFLYQLIARGELSKARKMLNGTLPLPSDYKSLSYLVTYEAKKSPHELKQVYLRKKLLDKEIGHIDEKGVFREGRYSRTLEKVGIASSEFDVNKNRLREGFIDEKGRFIRSNMSIGKVRRVPLVGFSVALSNQIFGNFKKDITESFKFWKNPKKGIKGMWDKNYAETIGVLQKGALKPLSAQIESPLDMYSELKKRYIEHDFYRGMGNTMLFFVGKNYGEISNPLGKMNSKLIERISVFENLSTTQKNQLIRELETNNFITKGGLSAHNPLSERKKTEIILKVFNNIRFRKTAGAESHLISQTYEEITSTLNSYERQGRNYDISQVNYVRSLGRRYIVSKMLIDPTRTKKGLEERQAYLDKFTEESSGAKGALELLLNQGKFKLEALTTALGFTEVYGFSEPSFPSIIDYKEKIHESAVNKSNSKNISFNAALKEAEKEHNAVLQTRITDIRHQLVNLMAGQDYAKQKREGKNVTYTEVYKKLDRMYDTWGRNPEKFLDNIQNEIYKYKQKELNITFEEEYLKTIKDTGTFLSLYDSVFVEYEDLFKNFISKTQTKQVSESKASTFLSKEEYINTLHKEGYLGKIEKAEGRVAEAQEEIITKNPEVMDAFAKTLTNSPSIVYDSKNALIYENGKYRMIDASSEPIQEMEKTIESRLESQVLSDKSNDDILEWFSRGFLTKREERLGELRSNMINTKLPPIIGGSVMIDLSPLERTCPMCSTINHVGNKKCTNCGHKFVDEIEPNFKPFDPSKEYDFSSVAGFEFIGKISGIKSYEDPIMQEKIKYLISKGKIGIQ